jgi:hypothetical protein
MQVYWQSPTLFERLVSELYLPLLVNPYNLCVMQVYWQSPNLWLRDLSVCHPSPC